MEEDAEASSTARDATEGTHVYMHRDSISVENMEGYFEVDKSMNRCWRSTCNSSLQR